MAQHKEGVLEAAGKLLDRLKAAGIRAQMDDSDQSMGWKAAQYEMKGVSPPGACPSTAGGSGRHLRLLRQARQT